jgi:periplasmic protein TonB
MFESTKQKDRLETMKYVVSLMLSLVVHVTLASVLILVPLVFCNVLHPDEMVTFLLTSPGMPERPNPPTPPHVAVARLQPTGEAVCHDCVPLSIPDKIQYMDPPNETPDLLAMPSLPGEGIPLTNPAGRKGMAELFAQAKLEKPLPPKPPRHQEPVPVVSTLQESKLILKPSPVYPKIAALTHVSGTVLLEAIIDEEGNVTNLTVISGPSLLVDAAREAVLQWKYSPTILNGEPVSVKTVVKITFRIR